MTLSRRPVLVLHEAFGDAARVDELDALVQVREVSAALEQLRVPVVTQAIGLDLDNGLRALQGAGASAVFNLVESLNGRGELIGLVPALLESAAITFTGSGSAAINLSSNKLLAKRWMRAHDIATPDWLGDPGGGAREARAAADEQWIVKSLWEHASLGLDDGSVVAGSYAAGERITERAATFGGQWFAERYIEGREFNVSLLEQNGQPHVLPIAEMTFKDYPPGKPRIVGYAAKWDEGAPEYMATERRFETVGPGDKAVLEALAKRCWTVFGLRGYARVDVRMDADGKTWVLEINANPCLSRDAGFAAAAAEGGLRYRRVVDSVLQAALRPRLATLRRAG